MITFFTRLAVSTFLALAVAASAKAEMRASPWVATAGSSVRLLLPDAPGADGVTMGGVEIRLDHGSKTYWRIPGETGVPTTADFAASTGLSDPQLQFPAPKAFDDGAGGIAYGYLDSLILPVRFRAMAGAKARLAVTMEYGVCQKNMCMPAQAAVSLSLGEGTATTELDQRFTAAQAAVPVAVFYNAAGPLAISGATLVRSGGDVSLIVTTRVPAGTATPDLFVEGKDVYATRRTSPDGAAEATFTVTASGTQAALGEITITLVAGQAAIETKLDLDALAKRP